MTMPDPRAYRRLAALLRDQVTSGMIAPGAQLPPIGELRHQHGHSRQTVTKAMGVQRIPSGRVPVNAPLRCPRNRWEALRNRLDHAGWAGWPRLCWQAATGRPL